MKYKKKWKPILRDNRRCLITVTSHCNTN